LHDISKNQHWLHDAQELAEMLRELRKAEALVEKLNTPELQQAQLEVKRKRAAIGRWLRQRGCFKIPW
jgi:hypothetical protein